MIEQLDKKELLAMLHKRCTKCGVVKYFGEFKKRSKSPRGVGSWCKACSAESYSKYRKENKEKEAERQRKYREENKEKEAERCRKYREENSEKVAESKRKYREKNKERIAEYHRRHREENKERLAKYERKYYKENKERRAERQRKHYEENREAYIERDRKRRARKVNAAGTHTAEQVKARFDYYGNKCIYCGSEENLEVEHRIPLARDGSDWPANLAPACKSCNCSKGTKTETEFKKILEERNE